MVSFISSYLSVFSEIVSLFQVISEEVAHTQRLPLAPLPSRTPLGPSNSSHNDTSFLAAQANGESIDIPEAILHNLMSHPYFTTSWLTQVPTTRPEETTTNPWMLGGEDLDEDVGEAVEEVTVALEVGEGFTEAATSTRSGVFDSQGEGVTESAVTEAALLEEFVVTESATAEVVLPEEADLKASSNSGETKDGSQTTQSNSIDETTTAGIPPRASDSTSSSETTTPAPTQRPLLDRWNSRFPAWTAFPARDAPTTVAIPSDDLEPADDYNSSPVGLSGMENPVSDEVGFTTWNYPGKHDEAMGEMLTTAGTENLLEDSATMPPENSNQERPTQDILLAPDAENALPLSTTPSAAVSSSEVTKVNDVTVTPTTQSSMNEPAEPKNTTEADNEETTETSPSEAEVESYSVTTLSPTTTSPEKSQDMTSSPEIPSDNLQMEKDGTTEYYPWTTDDINQYFPVMSDPLLSDEAMTLLDIFQFQGDTSGYHGEAPHYDFPVFNGQPSQGSEELATESDITMVSMEEQDSTTEYSIIQDLTTNVAPDASVQETPSDLSGQDMSIKNSGMDMETSSKPTQYPVTDGPSTQYPDTQSPSTESPVTQYQTTKDDSSQELTSRASTIQPSTVSPLIQEVTSQSPVVQDTTTELPSSQETTERPLDPETTTTPAPLPLYSATTPPSTKSSSAPQDPDLPEPKTRGPTTATEEPTENPTEGPSPTTPTTPPNPPSTDLPTSTKDPKQPEILPLYDYYYNDNYGSSNVLPPAPASNEERLDLGALERTGDQAEEYYYDDYYPTAVYLDNVDEVGLGLFCSRLLFLLGRFE